MVVEVCVKYYKKKAKENNEPLTKYCQYIGVGRWSSPLPGMPGLGYRYKAL